MVMSPAPIRRPHQHRQLAADQLSSSQSSLKRTRQSRDHSSPSSPASAPPDMPLPALPVAKTRGQDHDLPNLGHQTSQRPLDTPTSRLSHKTATTTARSTTPSALPTLKTRTSVSRFASAPVSALPSSPILSPSSSVISIGAFPRPPSSKTDGPKIGDSPAISTASSPSVSTLNSPTTPASATASTSSPPVTGLPRPHGRSAAPRGISSGYGQITKATDTSAVSHSLLATSAGIDRSVSTAPDSRDAGLPSSTAYSTELPNTASATHHERDSRHSASRVASVDATKLIDDALNTQGNVLVSVRIRPDSDGEDQNSSLTTSDWTVNTRDSRVTYDHGLGGEFSFDHVFAPRHHNARVYNDTTKSLVRRVMQGFNGTVFAYGMTGTGKTFSMQGISSSPGIIPLAITDIFSYIRETPNREFLLRASYLEIYNEKIYDLLSPDAANTPGGAGQQEEIKLRQDKRRGVYAAPLKEEIVQSPTQLLRVIARGDQARKTASTLYNARSSRSHAVVQIVIESRERYLPGSSQPVAPGIMVSTLSLIDLAGSEKAAGVKDRRVEGSHINKSLLTLGTIIARLSGENDVPSATPGRERDVKHLPYRDSKLTRLLQPALSGDSLVSILCTVRLAPAGSATTVGETLNTLRFASRAKNNIVSHAKRNESMNHVGGDAASRALLERYRSEIEDLKRQLQAQQKANVDAQRAEDDGRWRDEQRDSVERHETQLMEIQLARTALKERIQHLNRLILSSRSSGVNKTSSFSDTGDMSSVEGVGIALGSPGASRRPSADSMDAQTGRQEDEVARRVVSGGHRARAIWLHRRSDALLEEDGAPEAGELGSAAEQKMQELRAELADKTAYILILERRLEEVGQQSKSSMPVGQQGVMDDRDEQIAQLRAELARQTDINKTLLMATSRRMSSRVTSLDGQSSDYGWPRTESMGSHRSYNFSRPGPTMVSNHRKQISIDEMTRMLDGMLQHRNDSDDLSARRDTTMSFGLHGAPPLTA